MNISSSHANSWEFCLVFEVLLVFLSFACFFNFEAFRDERDPPVRLRNAVEHRARGPI